MQFFIERHEIYEHFNDDGIFLRLYTNCIDRNNGM